MKEESKIGRPSKFTPERKDRLLYAISLGMSYVRACMLAGISDQTYYNWHRKATIDRIPEYVEFFEQMKIAEIEGELENLEQINVCAKQGSWQAAAHILRCRQPERYGDKKTVNVGGTLNSSNGDADVHTLAAQLKKYMAVFEQLEREAEQEQERGKMTVAPLGLPKNYKKYMSHTEVQKG